MNFALSIIALTLVVALILFFIHCCVLLKRKKIKKRDELNKALYFSRLQEVEQR